MSCEKHFTWRIRCSKPMGSAWGRINYSNGRVSENRVQGWNPWLGRSPTPACLNGLPVAVALEKLKNPNTILSLLQIYLKTWLLANPPLEIIFYSCNIIASTIALIPARSPPSQTSTHQPIGRSDLAQWLHSSVD